MRGSFQDIRSQCGSEMTVAFQGGLLAPDNGRFCELRPATWRKSEDIVVT